MWSTAIFGLLYLQVTLALEVRLFHRIYHPSAPVTPFTERGTIHVTGNHKPELQLSDSWSDDLHRFAAILNGIDDDYGAALYQVALESEDHLSSVKTCHLVHATSEVVVLHTSDSSDFEPRALDFFVFPTLHDGSCPQPSPSFNDQFSFKLLFDTYASAAVAGRINTTVDIVTSRLPPLPELRTPPPLTPQGEPLQPVAEKTFFQKYWMYIIAVVIALLLSGGGPEEQREGK